MAAKKPTTRWNPAPLTSSRITIAGGFDTPPRSNTTRHARTHQYTYKSVYLFHLSLVHFQRFYFVIGDFSDSGFVDGGGGL